MNSLTGKPRSCRRRLLKGVLIRSPSVQWYAVGTFHEFVYILCIYGSLKGFGRKFEYSLRMEFTVSVITNQFQVCECTETFLHVQSTPAQSIISYY